MACYNHEILVQYLRDVYSMELLRNKVQVTSNSLYQRIKKDKDGISSYQCRPLPVSKEVQKSTPSVIEVLEFSVSIIGAYFFDFVAFHIPFIGKLLGVVGFLLISGLILFVLFMENDSYKSEIKRNQNNFEKEVAEYEALQQRAAQCQADLDQITPIYNSTQAQLQEIQQNLTDAYSVNIIPNRYRTIYYAYYLYDYFSSCQETDLDRIIQTMLLDQIIAKLNQIIAQQTETILNQRMILAKQDAQMEALQENHNAHLRSLAQIEQNQALQTNYLDMLDTNTRITNFFVTADYINKYL